jgi:hypothetical protein
MDRLAKIYIKIRTAAQELTKKYEAEVAALNEQKQVIANAMKDQMQASGVTSMKTPFGTAILGKKTRYWTQDWEEFEKFCLQQNTIAFLEKRIAQSNMSQFLEENPGVVPPGLNAETEFVVSVRKSN